MRQQAYLGEEQVELPAERRREATAALGRKQAGM